MRKLMLFVGLFLFVVGPAFTRKKFTDSFAMSAYLIHKGNLIDVKIDSVFLMNARTYRTYDTALQVVKKKQNLDNEIIALQAQELFLLKKRMPQQRSEYKELADVTGKLLDNSTRFVSRTDQSLPNLEKQANDLINNLLKAQGNLDSALSGIKVAQKKRWELFGSG